MSLSRQEAIALSELEEDRGSISSRHQDFIDESKLIVDGYSTVDRLSHEPDLAIQDEASPSHVSQVPPPLNSADLNVASLFARYNLQSDTPGSPSSGEYHVSPFDGSKQPISLTRNIMRDEDTCNYPFLLGQARSEDGTPSPVLPVTDGEKLRLISAFIRETGTWCETTDSQMHFTVKSIHKMMESPSFVAAALSLASRQMDSAQMRQRSVTLELYQYAIQLLLCQDPARADTSTLATCTLLCVYEMMASRVEEWRRHLKGCAGFLRAQKWNGSSEGIVKASFWAFARIGELLQ